MIKTFHDITKYTIKKQVVLPILYFEMYIFHFTKQNKSNPPSRMKITKHHKPAKRFKTSNKV